MIHLPVLRWGQPYTSLEVDDVVHFSTGEPIAKVSHANGGLIGRDMRKAHRAREVLREIPIDDLIARVGAAGELYMNATLPMGDGTQSPDEFAKAQSASTGLPEHMCRANMKKNGFVLAEMRRILDVADARALVRRALVGLRRRARRAGQLPGAESRARPGAAVELARRAHAVAADHPDADRPGPQARPAGAVDAVPHGGGVLSGRHPARGDLDLSRRRRRRRGGARSLRARADLRRHRDGRSLSRQRQSAGARPRLLEDPARRRRGRQLGEVSRPDGRQRLRQQRPRLHQLLRHLGVPAHARDRRRAGEAAGRRPSAQARRSRGEPGGVHDSRRGGRDLGRQSTPACRPRASPT